MKAEIGDCHGCNNAHDPRELVYTQRLGKVFH